MRFIIVFAHLCACLGFAPSDPTRLLSLVTPARPTVLFLSSEDESNKRSFFEGMQREPTDQELSIMDDMITKLADAPPYELPNAVSRAIRVVSSPRFFLRIAERADMAPDDIEREKLSSLAEALVTTIQAVVEMTEDSLDERAKDVEKVVKAASEPDSGEFLVPLSKERIDDMRTAMKKLDIADLNEGFLSTVDAWMNKAHQDGMDGMVTILQKVLQIYAGRVISSARIRLLADVGAAVSGKSQATANAAAAEESNTKSAESELLERMLSIDTDSWDMEIRKGFEGGECTKDQLVKEIQRTMEGVILGLENGSMAQRVQAEYLRELITRVEAV